MAAQTAYHMRLVGEAEARDSAIRFARNTAAPKHVHTGTVWGIGQVRMTAEDISRCQDDGQDVRHVRLVG